MPPRPPHAAKGRRGRPPKYGQPSRVVAVTLPETAVTALQAIHEDLGWAIVTLVQKTATRPGRAAPRDAHLVEVGDGQSLIVVDPRVFRRLPDVQIVPLSETQAFLAFEPGRGMADLELAVRDRRAELKGGRERDVLGRLVRQLRQWRRDRRLTFDNRSIIIVGQSRRA